MTISSSDLKLYKSSIINNGSANGGRMSYNEIIDNQISNLFPSVTQAERTAGLTRYRKAYAKIKDAGNETFYNAKFFLINQTAANDYIQIKAGTNTDVQSDAITYTNWHGVGKLNSAVIADSTTLIVDYEVGSGITTGDSAYLSDGTNDEFIDVSNVSWVDTQATVTLSSGIGYSYGSYATSGTILSSLIDFGDMTSSFDSVVVVSGAGTFDSNYLTVHNNGCVEDVWTITFTSSTAFSCAGVASGSIGAGTISSTFTPTNTNTNGTGNYYFNITTSAWGGTFTAGNTIVFNTHHAANAVWFKEVVPAGSASYSNNYITAEFFGESA